MIAFTLAPMALMAIYAMRSSQGQAWTFKNFANFFSPLYMKVLWESVYIAIITTAISLAIGYPAAYFISVLPRKQRDIFLVLSILPMWMNFLLRTYSWMNILGRNGLINKMLSAIGIGPVSILYTRGAVYLGMLYNFLPFMIYPIYAVLIKISPSYLEAAKDLGASSWSAFWKITMPLSMPGVITGISMVFMPAVSTFVIPELLEGGHTMYIGNLIQHQFLQKGDWNFGSAISMILMAFVLLSMMVLNKFDTSGSKEDALW
ncbi:MAG: ABC transporter permease [Eubacteriaceae bacterium]|nr:ABC transporter permease [Eubacteriaceae bacterium]